MPETTASDGSGEDTGDYVADTAAMGERVGGTILNLKGCAPILIVAVVIITLVIAYLASRDSDDDDDKAGTSTQSPSAPSSATETPTESTSPSTAPSESPSATEVEPTDDPTGEIQRLSGSSGDQIGCITCDGQSRYLHLEHPGVGVGDGARPDFEVVWPTKGTVVEFGAVINGTNQGRYGVALFANGATYYAGCTLEIGQTTCSAEAKTKIKKGDRLTIIIGEGGTLQPGTNEPASRGEFTVSWRFDFRPA